MDLIDKADLKQIEDICQDNLLCELFVDAPDEMSTNKSKCPCLRRNKKRSRIVGMNKKKLSYDSK
jgi:hypothetical protein